MDHAKYDARFRGGIAGDIPDEGTKIKLPSLVVKQNV